MKNQKIGNKGQVAMEYLMTYGWAVLVISIAAIIAWYFGLFNLGSTVGGGYSGFGEVIPEDFALRSDGTFIVVVENAVGAPITVTEVSARMLGTTKYAVDVPCNISTGAAGSFTITGLPDGTPGERYTMNLVMVVFEDSRTPGISHTSAGKIWSNYEG